MSHERHMVSAWCSGKFHPSKFLIRVLPLDVMFREGVCQSLRLLFDVKGVCLNGGKLGKWPSRHRKNKKSRHRLAAEKILFPRRWYDGTISTNLEVIWGIPAQIFWWRTMRWHVRSKWVCCDKVESEFTIKGGFALRGSHSSDGEFWLWSKHIWRLSRTVG